MKFFFKHIFLWDIVQRANQIAVIEIARAAVICYRVLVDFEHLPTENTKGSSPNFASYIMHI